MSNLNMESQIKELLELKRVHRERGLHIEVGHRRELGDIACGNARGEVAALDQDHRTFAGKRDFGILVERLDGAEQAL